MKSKEELIEIYNDTMELSHMFDAPFDAELLTSDKDYVSLVKSVDTLGIYHVSGTRIAVENVDCIVAAGKLSRLGKTCILNMASYKHPGGGVRKGAMSQEEELARRSMLMLGLPESYYPLKKNQFLYNENVTFIKDRNYNLCNPFDLDVITIAAIDFRNVTVSNREQVDEFDQETRKKIRAMLWEPHAHGCDNLVLSAFGCGVFKNDPVTVAAIFKEELKNFSFLYDNIIFAIFNDANSNENNFSTFRNIIDGFVR